MSFVSNVVWRTVVLYTRLKPNGKFRVGLKGIQHLDCVTLFMKSHLSCLAICIYLYSTLNSFQIKKIIGNVTAKNYLTESLSSIVCFVIQGNGSSWKRFDPEIYFGNLTQLSFLSSRT